MRRSPPPPSSSSLHSNFFSSLKQVEKRLKLETPTTQNIDTNSTTESLSTPIYLATHNNSSPTNLQDSTEPPLAFLSSNSCQNLLEQHHPTDELPEPDGVDDIQRLMQLLGLSKTDEEEQETGCACDCEGGFFEKIVGVKGPKCKKEVERLEGWISYFVKNKIEPFRLAILFLGKAAFQSDGGLEFPSTIQDFLKYDPPRD